MRWLELLAIATIAVGCGGESAATRTVTVTETVHVAPTARDGDCRIVAPAYGDAAVLTVSGALEDPELCEDLVSELPAGPWVIEPAPPREGGSVPLRGGGLPFLCAYALIDVAAVTVQDITNSNDGGVVCAWLSRRGEPIP